MGCGGSKEPVEEPAAAVATEDVKPSVEGVADDPKSARRLTDNRRRVAVRCVHLACAHDPARSYSAVWACTPPRAC